MIVTSRSEEGGWETKEKLKEGPTKIPSRRSLTDKSVVLDMDLTLLCTIGDGSNLSQHIRSNYQKAYKILTSKGIIVPTTLMQFGGSGKAINNDVVKRPGLEEFLSFCRTVFKHVILWSAGQSRYVYDTVRLVIGDDIFDHVYTAQDIVPQPLVQRGNVTTMVSTKPLELLFKRFPDITIDKVIIIDDLRPNFIPNPRNGVWIPPFTPNLIDIVSTANTQDLENMCGDYCLFRLIHFLADEEFLKVADVRDYDLEFFIS